MANTSPRPVIASTTGLVTYTDASSVAYPALVLFDHGNSVDLLIVDPVNGYINNQPPGRLDPPAHGRKPKYVVGVLDKGNTTGGNTAPYWAYPTAYTA